jgi:hypothetical protein
MKIKQPRLPGGDHVRPTRAGTRSLAALALLAALAAPGTAVAAGAGSDVGTGQFGLTPLPSAAGQQRSYFSLTVAAGRVARDTAVISNQSRATERLLVTISRGVTAVNSGSGYQGLDRRCTGPSCWVTGLPARVTLGPGASQTLPFRVAVPAGTRSAQYLAGITAQSAARPRPVRIGSGQHASAKAVIIDQVTVGVAVTVGRLSQLRTAVVIRPVTGAWIGSLPRLSIPVRNPGQTFARATGTLSCRTGARRRTYPVIMNTVLPGTGAVLSVNALGLKTGSTPCTVRLRDNAGHLDTWSGIVRLPPRVLTRTYHPAKGVYVSLPESTIPPWAIALMIMGALIIGCLLVPMVRRRMPGRSRPSGTRARPSGSRARPAGTRGRRSSRSRPGRRTA